MRALRPSADLVRVSMASSQNLLYDRRPRPGSRDYI